MAMKVMGLVLYNVAWAESYVRTKWYLHPSRHLATIHMGRKSGADVPFLGIHSAVWPQQTWAENWGLSTLGGAGSPSNIMSPGTRPTSTSLPSGMNWHLDPSSRLTTTYMGQKLWVCSLFFGGGGKFHLDTSNRLATIY